MHRQSKNKNILHTTDISQDQKSSAFQIVFWGKNTKSAKRNSWRADFQRIENQKNYASSGKRFSIKGEGGFVSVAGMGLLIVAIALIATLSAIGLAQIEHNRKTQICRVAVLELQSENAMALNRLEFLNTLARYIRAAQGVSILLTALAVVFPALTIFAGRLFEVARSATKFVERAQQLVIQWRNIKYGKILFEFTNSIMKRRDGSRDGTIMLPVVSRLHVKKIKYRIGPDEYLIDSQIEKKQTTNYVFEHKADSHITHYLRFLWSWGVKKSEGLMFGTCVATVEKGEDGLWYPTMKKGKWQSKRAS